MRAYSLASRQHQCIRLFRSHKSFSSAKNSVTIIETPTRDGQWLLPTMIHQHAAEITNAPPPILLVAGWSGVATDWGALPKLLGMRTNRHVITYDARGMGHAKACSVESDELLNNVSLTSMAQDAMDVLTQVTSFYSNSNMQSFGVGGVSMGGMVAQMVAGASRGLLKDSLPESTDYNVSSLMLMSTTPGGHVHCDKTAPPCASFLTAFDDWIDHHDCPHTLEQTNRQCAQRFFSSLGDDFLRRPGRRKLQEKLIDSFVNSRNNFSTSAGKGMLAQREAIACEKFDSRQFLSKIKIPTLIVHGKKDRVIPVGNAHVLQELVGRDTAQLEILPDADHLLWITHGLELWDILGDFYLSLDE